MAVFNEPTQWNEALGSQADANTIPEDASAGSGEVSMKKLWQVINQTPLNAGGKAPKRKDINALFKIVGEAVFYMMNGGLWSYNSAFDYAIGRVVLYTDGNLYKCIQANDSTDPKAPTDSNYWSKIPILSDFDEFGFVTGDFKAVTTNNIQNGWLLGNSARVSRTTNSKLYQFAGDNDLIRDAAEQAAYESDPDNFTGRIYGPGDGSSTFEIPNLCGRSLMGALTSMTVGRYQPEQLPNINGTVKRIAFPLENDASGALSTYDYAGLNIGGTGGMGTLGIELNAHNSNSVYTDSGAVHPLSLALNYIIKT